MQRRSPWKTNSSRVVYENPWVRVREDHVTRPGGGPGLYGVIEIRPSVGVVATNDRDEIVLVGQWRYSVDRYSWEIPRGGSDHGSFQCGGYFEGAVAAKQQKVVVSYGRFGL